MAVLYAEAQIWKSFEEPGVIWSGTSFLHYHHYRELLSELPASAVAKPTHNYGIKRVGNRDYIFGELIYSLMGYEGYLRDKAWPLEDCAIRAVARPASFILEFEIACRDGQGKPRSQTWQVLRQGETRYLLFLDYYRPL